MEEKDPIKRIYLFFGFLIGGLLLFLFGLGIFGEKVDREAGLILGPPYVIAGFIGIVYWRKKKKKLDKDFEDKYLKETPQKNIESIKKLQAEFELKCPKCGKVPKESKGSPVSPYINVYRCSCGWRKLRCGNSSCDGYMEAAEMGYPNTVRYTCTKCGWSGTGVRFS